MAFGGHSMEDVNPRSLAAHTCGLI